MNHARGTLIVGDAYGQHAQRTFTCAHCNRPRVLDERSRNWCDTCDALVCADAVCASECLPWRRKLDEMEARQRFREALTCN